MEPSSTRLFPLKTRALADSERRPRDETCATHSPPHAPPWGTRETRQEMDMRYCYKVPAEAWRPLRDARWEKLRKADFWSCLRRGGDVFGFPAFFMWRGGAASAVPPPHWGPSHLEEPPAQVFRGRLPGCGGGRRPPRRVGAVQRAPGHSPSKGRSKVLMAECPVCPDCQNMSALGSRKGPGPSSKQELVILGCS